MNIIFRAFNNCQVNVSGQMSLDKLQLINDDGDKIYYGDGIAATGFGEILL